ncbi:GDSL-type esterase/lipase family protein [Actinoplanes couchii]|uniref:DUF459 domain-containing protein n=1 Tax=Actinoplanes couchii TaxID=403638 RepID=UPI00194040A8|nr:GDSL-type esterase/lipase family protein [Actinoplanes couchii]MDR6320352.1 lysophospholipase L1-like esterase [Actinoplanes couchii]
MGRDLRIRFVGDSFVAGVGDPACLGWTGRLAARSHPVTAYNLGVRRQTSDDIRDRWLPECDQRLRDGSDHRLVLSFGVNDTTVENGAPRVGPGQSTANLGAILGQAARRRWRVLMVGPPPVGDHARNLRTAALDERFTRVCQEAGVPYVPVYPALRSNGTWMDEIRTGDGAHPGAAGYAEITALIAPHWDSWLRREGPTVQRSDPSKTSPPQRRRV